VNIRLLCVGKLGTAPEAKLALDYAARATATGRALGFGPVQVVEIETRKPGRAAEGAALIERVGSSPLLACDEHGDAMGSRALAAFLARLRDDGVRDLVMAIGGADGLDPSVLALARWRLAFGPQTWPHALVRVLLAEQLYRAATILAGAPYHRD
jgi:23S rRNA (pseudouridine1915-N3)-methyltransferase